MTMGFVASASCHSLPFAEGEGEGWGGVRLFAPAALLLAALLATPAHAQLAVPAKGEGYVSASYQVVTDHYHLLWNGDKADAGHIKAHSAQLRIDYGLTDRLAVNFSVPYIYKRYVGDFPHNTDPFEPHAAAAVARAPGGVLPMHDGEEHIDVLDDGDFHGSWQDWQVGVRWRWRDWPWALTPFATYSQPMRDYTWFAHAAPGTHQRKLALGLAAGHHFGPRWPKLYAQAAYSYTFVEEVLDIPVDFSTLYVEAGWFVTPTVSVRGFASYRKTHGGLDFPIDFPSRTNELWFNHDRVQRIDYLNVGLGASWNVTPRWTVAGDWFTTAWGENGHAIHNAVIVSVSRAF